MVHLDRGRPSPLPRILHSVHERMLERLDHWRSLAVAVWCLVVASGLWMLSWGETLRLDGLEARSGRNLPDPVGCRIR